MSKKKLKFQYFSKGFTLIELLVVLAILALLAAAILAAINPIEQINKGRDATSQEQASEFVTAVASYASSQNAPVWGVNGCTAAPSGVVMTDPGIQSCISELINKNELKASFLTANASNFANLYVTQNTSDGTSAIVCFKPLSKSIQTNPNTKYTKIGASGTLYWCSL